MKILIGSLGDLGYLVKPLPAGDQPAWRRFEDEASLIAHLRGLSLGELEIRSVFRTLRAQGRVILAIPEAGIESRPARPLPRRSSPAPAAATS